MLKWGLEKKELLEIRKVIAVAWRMNDRQLDSCCRKLHKKQAERTEGHLGRGFLKILDEISDMEQEEKRKIWFQLARDADRLLALIRKYQNSDDRFWKNALYKVEMHYDKYFKTALGRAFIFTLKEKLGLDISEQKQAALKKKQEGMSCQNNSLSDPNQKGLEGLISWLMEDDEPHKTKNKKCLLEYLKLPDEAVVAMFAGASICLFGVWLYGQVERSHSFWYVQRMKATAAAQQDIVGEQGIDENTSSLFDTAGIFRSQTNARETVKENVKRPKILAQYQDVSKEYPGLYGWLQIPDTQIDLPVMRPLKENEFYLDHDFTGAESAEGALFVDPLNSRWPQDDNIVIYGHNMKNGHMFGVLSKYTNEDYFRAHKEIHFDTIYETGVYEAVAVVKTRILNAKEQGFRYYQFFQYDVEEEFLQCLDFVKKNQLFDTGSELKYGDQILMLSTCEYSQENGRLVIVARKR